VIRDPATSPVGEPYLAISRPLVGADGSVVGALFVGVDEAELREVEFRLGEKILIYGIAMAAATVLILFVALRVLLRPLEILTATTLTIANGEDVTVMPAVDRQDEVGRLARAIQFLGAESSEKRRLQARQEQLQRAAEEQTRIARETMIANIERELDADLPRIASRAEDMARAAHATLEASTLVTNESAAVTGQAQIAAENAAQVGHASDQLTFAIREIAQQINGSTEATGRTVTTVNRIAEHTTQLHKAVQSISEVSNLITAIAHQTNLLALNATIEAARAGAVGKGFAVVAGEVKALSRQTTDATKLIHDQLGEIQNATSMLVEGVAEIRVAVDQLNERNFSVASAVEQQEASTAEIGRAIARSREQIDGVSIGMERVAALSSEMVERSSAVEETSREIVGETRELNIATKTILRTDGANRRLQERFRLELPVTLIAAGHRIDGRLIDLSEGGAAVDVGADYDVRLPMKTSVALELADSEVAGTLIGKITPDETTLRLRVQFAVSQRALRDGLVKPLALKALPAPA
jgi:methyl-accepting chemotaxis protein